jgi:2-dehydropantoate 2-reductase
MRESAPPSPGENASVNEGFVGAPVAVFGAGAVGCFFGGMLARAGTPVTLIGRPGHVGAIAKEGLTLVTARGTEHIRVAASTDAAAVRDARLVLVAVKSFDTEAAGRALASYLAEDAVLVSLQNGVDNAERLAAPTSREAYPAVVWVAASMSAPGTVTHAGRGDLVLGDARAAAPGREERRRTLEGIARLFEDAGVPCALSREIEAELWSKLAANCAFNPVSALGRARYGRIGSRPDSRRLLVELVAEVLAVAGAAGIRMGERDVLGATLALTHSMADATSSMAQDLARGRRTEIDALNGFVARRGEELGVPTPLNRSLAVLVKLLEESRA